MLFQLETITPCPITTCPCKKSLSSFLVGLFRYWKTTLRSPHSLLFSRLNSPNVLSLSSQQRGSSPHIIAVASSGPAPTGPCLSCAEGSGAGRRTPRGISPEQRGRIPSLHVQATLLGMQPRIWLAFWSASTCCWVMLSFSSTSTLKSFSSELLSINSLPSLYLCLGLPWPMCRTLHVAQLNFLMFAWAHVSGLSRSLWMPTLPSRATQPGVIRKLAEGVLNPTIHVTEKDFKPHQSQYWLLRNASWHRSPLGLWVIDCNPLSVTIHPILYPPSGPSIKSMSLQFRQRCCAGQCQMLCSSPGRWHRLLLPYPQMQ